MYKITNDIDDANVWILTIKPEVEIKYRFKKNDLKHTTDRKYANDVIYLINILCQFEPSKLITILYSRPGIIYLLRAFRKI